MSATRIFTPKNRRCKACLKILAFFRRGRKKRMKRAYNEPVNSRTIFMGRLACGSDLLRELNDLCACRNVTLGRIEAIGAVQKANIGFYDQTRREYRFLSLDFPMEITHLTGNISLKEEKPFVHAHATLVDENGNVYGGHLAGGTVVFACEFVLEAFEGPRFERKRDDETGLPLWRPPA